jgi:hypothetical protein
VGSDLVIDLPPPFNEDLCFQHCVEDLYVQQLISEPTVEALDLSILPGRLGDDRTLGLGHTSIF